MSGLSASVATSRMGLLGSTVLPPVTFTQVALFGTPVPMLKPYCTLPSLVPTITVEERGTAKASWLMNERSARVFLVRLGLLAYQSVGVVAPLMLSHTRLLPAIRWSQ